jgi:glutathione S-transferase
VSQPLTVIGSYVSPYVRKVLACMNLKGLDYEFDPITPFFGMGVREARRGMMQV